MTIVGSQMRTFMSNFLTHPLLKNFKAETQKQELQLSMMISLAGFHLSAKTLLVRWLWKKYPFMTPSSGKLCEDASQDCALLSFSNDTEKTFEIRLFSSLFYRGRKSSFIHFPRIFIILWVFLLSELINEVDL